MCAVWCISPDHISYLAWQACQYLNDALTTQDKLPTQREVETLFESLLRLSQPPSQLYFALFFSFFFPLFHPSLTSLSLSLSVPSQLQTHSHSACRKTFHFWLVTWHAASAAALTWRRHENIYYIYYIYKLYILYVCLFWTSASNNYQK